jgi:very-short-patch-repair endonuclease
MAESRRPRETTQPGWWGKLHPEARRMRKEPTPAEEILWEAVRGHRLGVRFRRQHAIDRFIVDFACLPAKLIVEVDGEIHDQQAPKDRERDAVLTGMGYLVRRYQNQMVLQNTSTVTNDIKLHLDARLKRPSLPGEGGRSGRVRWRDRGEAVVRLSPPGEGQPDH